MSTTRSTSESEAHPLAPVAAIYERLERGTLADRAYTALRHAILQGDLPPRTRLTEVELASIIPASRTPVREALRRLRDEGHLIVGPSRLLEVRDIDLQESFNTYQILEVLEPLAARLAARRISNELIQDLRQSVELTEFLFEKGRWDDVTRESKRYHELIYEASGNPRLVQVIRRLREDTHRFRRFHTRDRELVRRSLREDREIIEALARRNPDEAFQVMYEHIHVSTERIATMLQHGQSLDDDSESVAVSSHAEPS